MDPITRVVPDTDGFRRRLESALNAAEAGLEVTIPVNFDVDTAGLRTQLEALEKSKVTIPVDIGDGSEIERLQARLQALDNSDLTIPLEIGDGSEIERLQARLEALDSKSITIDVDVRGVETAASKLEYLWSLTNLLDGKTVVIDIDVRGLGGAIAELAAMRTLANAADEGLGNLGRTGRQAFSGMNSQMTNVLQGLGLAIALAPALAVAGAGIAAAWGAISTGILAIPAAIALIGVPLGLLLLDFDTLKKSVAKVTPEFQKFRKAASEALAAGLGPALEKLATGVLPKIQDSVTRVTATMGTLAQRSADWLASTQGVAALNAMLNNVDRTLQSMSRGLGDIGKTFLLLAGQATAFDVLSSAINEFGASFRSHVVNLIQSGTLDRAMRGLRDMLVELGQGFADLVNNGIKLFAGAAPGVNKFLDSLSGFFNRFNWERLGRSVGRVFSGLAESLDQVDTQTIRDIEDAFDHLGDVFNDPKFQDNIKTIIGGIDDVIWFVGELSKAFAEVGAIISVGIGWVRQFASVFESSADRVRSAWAGGLGLDTEDPLGLKALEDSLEFGGFPALEAIISAGILRLKQIVTTGLLGIRLAFQTGWSALTIGSDLVWKQLAATFTVGFGLLQGLIGTGFASLKLAWDIGWTSLQLGAQIAWQLIPTYVQTGMSLVQTAIQTGMTLAQTAMQVGWQQIQLGAQIAWQLIPTYVQTGMTLAQTAVQTGMTLVQSAMQLGWQQVQLATETAWQLIPVAVQTGWTLIQAAVQTGTATVQAAISTAWSVVQAATATAWATIQAAVSTAWATITGDTQSGASNTQSAVSSAWSTIQSLTGTAWATIVATIKTAVDNFVTAVRTGVNNVLAAMRALPGQIVSAIGNLGSLLVGAGRALMDGLLAGIRAGFERVLAFARSIAGRIAAVKGPRQYDLRVLRPAGEWLMRGLADGLRLGMDRVRALVARFTAEFDRLRFAAPDVDLRGVVDTGSAIGDGLLGGLSSVAPKVIAEAQRITDAINGEFARVDTTAANQAFDDLAARTQRSVRRATAEVNASIGTPGAAGREPVTINNYFYTESSERESSMVARTQRRQAAMGIWR